VRQAGLACLFYWGKAPVAGPDSTDNVQELTLESWMRVNVETFRKCLDQGGDAPGAHVVLIAAHPDDEVIGATSVLLSNLAVTILHTTDGAPADSPDAQDLRGLKPEWLDLPNTAALVRGPF
jgi:hypothetical protein